jgi:hypothetical protein
MECIVVLDVATGQVEPPQDRRTEKENERNVQRAMQL